MRQDRFFHSKKKPTQNCGAPKDNLGRPADKKEEDPLEKRLGGKRNYNKGRSASSHEINRGEVRHEKKKKTT